jgi:cation diffusion facilitator family transporter
MMSSHSHLHGETCQMDTVHDHDCHESGGHHHTVSVKDTSGSRLLITLVLNLMIPTAQVLGGLYAGSMALISDAAHNFSDFTAILIAYFAYRIGKKGATLSHSFGYRRAEILAAMMNVALLSAASVFIIYEAVERFLHPQPVMGSLVILMAGIGVAGNGLSAWLLHPDAARSLNARGAFLHMVGDMLTSVAVLISGVILMYKPWFWLDPLFSLVIVVLILKNCWGILSEAVIVLMNATPKKIDLLRVQETIETVPDVAGSHYLHAWDTGSGIAFSAHIVVQDQLLSQTEKLSRIIREKLNHLFGIDHAVLQFETGNCGSGGVLCEMSCNGGGICGDVSITSRHNGKSQTIKENRMKWILTVLRIGLGLIFIYASIDKILHPNAFAEAVYNYQILPDQLINLTAIILPVLECLAGICLITGVWIEGSVTLINGMLIIFIAALGFNLSRGMNIQCGCFHAKAGEADQWEMIWTIVRDVGMLAAGIIIFIARKYRAGHKPLVRKNG